MIRIFRCPLRISLFGGGSDYREYFYRRPGAVIGFTINKYTYLISADRSNVEDYKFRLSYNKIEKQTNLKDLEHPLFRNIFTYYKLDSAFDFSMVSDLPARSGLSSSSALATCVAMFINDIKNNKPEKLGLARQVIMFERELLNEVGGIQDQLHCAYGGLNRFDFYKDDISCTPIDLSKSSIDTLNDSLVLVSTKSQRFASEVLDEQVKATRQGKVDSNVASMVEMVNQCQLILENEVTEKNLYDLGKLLNESWSLKKSLSSSVSNSHIDKIISSGLAAGAYGAKLCGAGAGGFILFILPSSKHKRDKFLALMRDFNPVDLAIDFEGPSKIVF